MNHLSGRDRLANRFSIMRHGQSKANARHHRKPHRERPARRSRAIGTWPPAGQWLVNQAIQDVLSRFVAALGGTLKLVADFGDEQLKLA
jgi:hypothetical protein